MLCVFNAISRGVYEYEKFKTVYKSIQGGVLLGSILLVFSALTGCKDASDSGGGTADSGGGVPAVTHYHVSMTTAQNGTLTAVPVIPSDGKVLKNTEIEFTAAPNPTYEVRSWEISGGQKISGGNPGDLQVRIKVTSDVTVSVIIGKEYTKVAYGGLAAYLASASSTEVNYIEITGTIPEMDLIGTNVFGSYSPSVLGAALKASGKKIALKLPSSVAPGTFMANCFATCDKIVSVENIPAGVTDMTGCFVECTGLTGAPSIPSGVTTMHSCFNGCTSLTTAPAVPESVTILGFCFEGCTELTNAPVVPAAVNTMFNCFNGCSKLTSVTLKCNYVAGSFNLAFNGCNALGAGSITVPKGTLGDYTGAAMDMGTTADKFKEAD